jgi:hypothetical protein
MGRDTVGEDADRGRQLVRLVIKCGDPVADLAGEVDLPLIHPPTSTQG